MPFRMHHGSPARALAQVARWRGAWSAVFIVVVASAGGSAKASPDEPSDDGPPTVDVAQSVSAPPAVDAALPPSVPSPPVAPAAPPMPAPEASAAATSQGRPVEIHAFASQGFIVTTGNDYIAPDTTNGSFQLSEVGVNLSKQLAEKLRLGVQAFAQNFALGGIFNVKADWFYLDYRWRDWLGLRVGRLKIPYGLYNEV